MSERDLTRAVVGLDPICQETLLIRAAAERPNCHK
jgi:hypothetical protein